MKRGAGPRADPAKTRAWHDRSRGSLKRGEPKRTPAVPSAARAEARARSRGRCIVCGRKAYTLHHVFPKRATMFPDLVFEADCLVLACWPCHGAHEQGARPIRLAELPECCFRLAARHSQRAVDFLLATYA